MEKWNNFIEKVGVDRLLHFAVGGLVCALVTIVSMAQEAAMQNLTAGVLCAVPLIGLAVVLIVAFNKEVMDEAFDWWDILASALGCVPVEVAACLGALFL